MSDFALLEAPAALPVRGRRRRSLLAYPQGKVGAGLLAAIVLLVAAGPLVAPHDPTRVSATTSAAGSAAHPFGTDLLGRDLLSRVLTGGRPLLFLPLVTVAIALAVAAVLGILAGYLGGAVDLVVTRLFDVQLAIPGVLLALLVITGFGRGDAAVVGAVALVEIPRFGRVLRAATQAVAPRDFVTAARARGESLRWIAFGELLPNIVPTLLVEAALGLTTAILAVSSLSFLGLGSGQATANWAVMVSDDRSLLFTHPFGGVLAPALLIAALAISINLIADALTRALGGRESETGR